MSAVLRRLKALLDVRAQRWIRNRIPPTQKKTLNLNSIFIIPSRFGVLYLFVCVVVFLLGTNYQNNLVMGLSFFLFSVFNTCIIFAYRNLSGLTLTGVALSCGRRVNIFRCSCISNRKTTSLPLRSIPGCPLRRWSVMFRVTSVELWSLLKKAAGENTCYLGLRCSAGFPLGYAPAGPELTFRFPVGSIPNPRAAELIFAVLKLGQTKGIVTKAAPREMTSLTPWYRTDRVKI